MKKILLTTALSFFALTGVANALIYTNVQDNLGITLAEGPIVDLFTTNTATYTHLMPGDFEVPWDIVNSASLTIEGYFVDGNNDSVSVAGSFVGTLNSGGSYGWLPFIGSWDNPSVSAFDVSSALSSWTTGASLGVTVTANGGFLDGIIEIEKSTFTLDYDNQTAPVPEPSTMLLFGAGLAGLVGYSRKRSSKKA